MNKLPDCERVWMPEPVSLQLCFLHIIQSRIRKISEKQQSNEVNDNE